MAIDIERLGEELAHTIGPAPMVLEDVSGGHFAIPSTFSLDLSR
jgi:hypothetical protein